MKKSINDYLKYLELKKKGLKYKRQAILREEDRHFHNKKRVAKIEDTQELKNKINEVDKKIDYFKKMEGLLRRWSAL